MKYEKNNEQTELITDTHDTEDKCVRLSNRRQLGVLISLLFLQFLSLCSDTFLNPFFPEEAEKKGLNKITIGIVFSSFELGRFLASPIAGSLVVKCTPKYMCVMGGTMTTVSCLAFGCLYYAGNSLFFPLCVMVRFVAGSGSAMLSIASMSLLLKATSYQRGTIVCCAELVNGGGYAVGPSLGVGLYELGGYTCTFWVLGGLMALLTVIQSFVLPNIEEKLSESGVAFWRLLKIPGLVLMFFHCVLAQGALASRVTLISTFLRKTFHVDTAVVGMWLSIWSAIYVCCCPLMAVLVNKGFIYSSMLLGWTLYIFVSFFAGPSPLLDFIFHGRKYYDLTIISLTVCQFTGVAIYFATFPASINLAEVSGYERDSLHTYGIINGMINCAFGLGSMIGPVAAGAIAESLNFPWLMTILGFLQLAMVISMAGYLISMKVNKQPLKPGEEYNILPNDKSRAEESDSTTELFLEYGNE